jgi:N6-L-threonylcarbamoyladenine synthase
MTQRILGIECSCDDTAAAVVDSEHNILANIVASQQQEHKEYKGVVPEIAARAHLDKLGIVIDQCLLQSNLHFKDIHAVAATSGPGLIGGVIVGSMYGKALASTLNIPFIAVNHLEAHALTARLTDNISFPYLLLLISGGHCQFVVVHSLGHYQILGRTLDDSVGEAFDKVAKMLNMDFPGGPAIEQASLQGDEHRFIFPKPLWDRKDSNMSFSGLKTAIKITIEKFGKLTTQDKNDIAASFQNVVCEILVKKTINAIDQYEKICTSNNYLSVKYRTFVISGGVGANLTIRNKLNVLLTKLHYNFVAPPVNLCTDNAAMVAFTGLERLKAGIIDGMNFKPRDRWNLEELKFL